MGLLRDYIAYAKATFQPTLTDAASQRLISAYVDMRKVRVRIQIMTTFSIVVEADSLYRISTGLVFFLLGSRWWLWFNDVPLLKFIQIDLLTGLASTDSCKYSADLCWSSLDRVGIFFFFLLVVEYKISGRCLVEYIIWWQWYHAPFTKNNGWKLPIFDHLYVNVQCQVAVA